MDKLKRGEAMGGVCPVCRVTGPGVQFLESGEFWVCRKCGCVFVPRGLREGLVVGSGDGVLTREEAKRRIEEAKGERGVVDLGGVVEGVAVEGGKAAGFVCPECGKVLKSALGLSGHLRSHRKVGVDG